MKCPLCKGDMSKGFTTLTLQFEKENIITIYDIPAVICNQCGEKFFDIETSQAIEKIKDNIKQIGLKMGFVKFNEAA